MTPIFEHPFNLYTLSLLEVDPIDKITRCVRGGMLGYALAHPRRGRANGAA